MPIDTPYITECLGNITGVGFEPGRSEVRIKTDASTITFAATPEQVNAALRLRSSRVKAIAVVQGDTIPRLLILEEVGRLLNRLTRKAAIYERWEGALKRLPQ